MRAAGANRIPATAPGAHHRAGPGQRQVPRPAQARLHGPGPRSRDASATFPHYVGGAPPKLLTGGLKRAVFHTDHGSACTSKALATVCRKPGATSAHGSRRHQRRGRTGRVDGCHPEARDPHEHTLPDRRAHPPPLLLRPPTPSTYEKQTPTTPLATAASPPPPNNKRQGPRAVVMEDDISSDSPGTGLTRHHSSSPRGPHLCPSDTPSPIKPLQTPSPTDFTDLLTTIDKLRRQFYARSQAFFAGILDESRRGLDTAGRYGVS